MTNHKFFALLRLVNCVTNNLLRGTSISLNHEKSLYCGIILFHISKLFSLSTALLNLIKNNYLRESDLLMRSFWETYINLVYICQEPEKRSSQFHLDELQKYLARRKVLIKYTDKEFMETLNEQIKETQAEITDLKKYLKSIDTHTNYEKFRWKNISTEQKSKELQLNKEYEILYRNWSELIHASSTTGQDYLKIENSSAKAIIPSDFNDDMIPHRLLFLSQYLIDALALVYKEYKFNSKNELLNEEIIDSLVKHYNDLNPVI